MKTSYNDNQDYDYLNYPYNLLIQMECKCDQFLFCFNTFDINKCKYYKMIIDNLPLFKIILNKNTKKQFRLPTNWSNSSLNSNDFFKIIFYIISFTDESIDYLMNKPHIKSIISLSLYILIINNHNNIKHILYLLEPLINNLKKKITVYLLEEESKNKLKELFNKYYLDTPDECFDKMNKWIKMLDDLIKN